MKMGKREKKGKKEKVQKDAQNNESEDSKDGILGLAAPKKAKDNLLRIEDISRHSSSSGKLGPILHSDIFL